MINHDTQQYRIPTERRMNNYTKVALGGTAAAIAFGVLASEIARDDPKYLLETKADQVVVTTINLVSPINIERTGPVEHNRVANDEGTSDAIERATLAFIQEYGVITKEGQASTVQENAKAIDATIHAETGGSVQPDTEFDTWYDTETGYIISSLKSETED